MDGAVVVAGADVDGAVVVGLDGVFVVCGLSVVMGATVVVVGGSVIVLLGAVNAGSFAMGFGSCS